MEKYQIAEVSGMQAHAGTKATEDVIVIAKALGFEPLYVQMKDLKRGIIHKLNRQVRFYKDWSNVYRTIASDAIVLLQHPFHYPQLTRERTLSKLKSKKCVHFISIVHDVEELRTLGKEQYHKREFDFMVKIADALIVHNNVMRDFFISKGIDKGKIIVLEIFDYLRDKSIQRLPAFEKSITIAGNLDINKSGYLVTLPTVNCKFHLYGPNYSLEGANNVIYGGILKPDQIPEVLTKGFGLIWDGDSSQTCKGGFGNYLRYNNPHKLSLYLASGLPVIIWKEAAEAKFVEENNIGYTIGSLNEITDLMETVSEEEYRQIAKNVFKLSDKLIKGEYMKKALDKAIRLFGEK